MKDAFKIYDPAAGLNVFAEEQLKELRDSGEIDPFSHSPNQGLNEQTAYRDIETFYDLLARAIVLEQGCNQSETTLKASLGIRPASTEADIRCQLIQQSGYFSSFKETGGKRLALDYDSSPLGKIKFAEGTLRSKGDYFAIANTLKAFLVSQRGLSWVQSVYGDPHHSLAYSLRHLSIEKDRLGDPDDIKIWVDFLPPRIRASATDDQIFSYLLGTPEPVTPLPDPKKRKEQSNDPTPSPLPPKPKKDWSKFTFGAIAASIALVCILIPVLLLEDSPDVPTPRAQVQTVSVPVNSTPVVTPSAQQGTAIDPNILNNPFGINRPNQAKSSSSPAVTPTQSFEFSFEDKLEIKKELSGIWLSSLTASFDEIFADTPSRLFQKVTFTLEGSVFSPYEWIDLKDFNAKARIVGWEIISGLYGEGGSRRYNWEIIRADVEKDKAIVSKVKTGDDATVIFAQARSFREKRPELSAKLLAIMCAKDYKYAFRELASFYFLNPTSDVALELGFSRACNLLLRGAILNEGKTLVALGNLLLKNPKGEGGAAIDVMDANGIEELSKKEGIEKAFIKLTGRKRNGAEIERELLAACLFQLATESNYSSGFYALGGVYEAGHGVPVDHLKAFLCYFEAYEMGHQRASFDLARYHENGIGGFPKNDQLAIKLYKEAADNGLRAAIDYLEMRGLR